MKICEALKNEFEYLGHLITSFSFELSLLWPLHCPLLFSRTKMRLAIAQNLLLPGPDICSGRGPSSLASLGPGRATAHSWGLRRGLGVQLVTGLRPHRQLPRKPGPINLSLPETMQQNPQLTVAKHWTQGHKVIIRTH